MTDELLLGCPVVRVDELEVPTGDIRFGAYPPLRMPLRVRRNADGLFVMGAPTWEGRQWAWDKEDGDG